MIRVQAELGALARQWDELAEGSGSPFMSSAWLEAWWSAFGSDEPLWLLLCDADGSLLAGAFLHRLRGKLAAAANVHSGEWNGLARDEASRSQLWEALVGLEPSRIHVQGLPDGAEGTRSLYRTLTAADYHVVRVSGPDCPWLDLPASFEELMASVSGSLRSQLGRRRRALESEGALRFRTIRGGDSFETDLQSFFELEASGWKGRAGTAILSEPATERLYRQFAQAALKRGWMRLYVLELDGHVIAADYGCVFARTGVLIKTGFDEAHGRLSPGLVLRAEVLRSSIEEGLEHYDFLGDAETYKLRWATGVRPRAQLFAYRGIARPGYRYRKSLRPLLKSIRDAVRSPVRCGAAHG